jgi:hypothetical protein
MHTSSRWIAGGSAVALAVFFLFSQTPVGAVQNGNGNNAIKDVIVVNGVTNPVPVIGDVTVSGSTTVSGAVAASQNGAWTMRIDPAFNQVTLPAAASTSFHYDSGFAVINDGATLDLGPFDTSDLAGLRFYGRAVNGDIHVEVLAVVDAFPIRIDSFTIPGEGGTVSRTSVYDYPPPSIMLRLTESGPGGSNYHVALVGR